MRKSYKQFSINLVARITSRKQKSVLLNWKNWIQIGMKKIGIEIEIVNALSAMYSKQLMR